MSTRRRFHILWFGLRFLVIVVPLVLLWWQFLMPYYAWLIMQLGAGTLVNVFGMPIVAGKIETGGLFNTDTQLVYSLQLADGLREPALRVALLVTNLPPFWALVLATFGITMRRRLAALAIGSGIIFAGHTLFIVVMMRYGSALQASPQLPTAIVQFFLTLPFLLWIVLAGWGVIAQYIGAAPARKKTTEKPTSE